MLKVEISIKATFKVSTLFIIAQLIAFPGVMDTEAAHLAAYIAPHAYLTG